MGYISCYNYTAQGAGEYRVGLINSNDLQALENHTFSYDGVSYTATKNLQNNGRRINIHIEERGTRVENSAEQFANVLNAAGIRVSDLFLGSYINWMEPGTVTYGFVNDYTSNPKFTLTWSGNQASNSQSVAVYPPSGSAITYGAGVNPPATPGYTDSRLLLEFAPTIADMSNGLFVVVRTEWSTHQTVQNSNYLMVDIYYWPAFLTGNNYESEPGETGFKPTGAYTSNNFPGQGGRPSGSPHKKDPDYAGDPITLPGAPDESEASAVGCGFINCYKIDTANLGKVGQCLYGSTLLGLIQSLSINPLDFIISLMIFPCSPNVGSSESIKLGGWVAAAAGGAALGFDASGYRLSSQFKTVSFGSVSIPENWGNFLDYSQTNIELYLPFVGSVSIDVSECMGGTIEVEYTIDFFTGMCVANVLCTRPNYVLPSGKAITNVHAEHAYQGNCAIQIPLSAVNYGSMVGSLINACTQGITNPVAGFSGIVSDAISGGLRPNVSSKGNIVANAGFCSVLYPYVRITRPVTAEPESYQEVMGLPSYINTSLGQCNGLCVCDDINLSGINGATENELNKIRQYCKDGVYV